MPLSRSTQRSQRQRRYSSKGNSSSSSQFEDPILLKSGHSLNFISQWFFLWVIPLLHRTKSESNFDPDSIELQEEESAQYAGERLGDRWKQEEIDYKEKASISRALMSAFGRPYLMLAFYKLFWIIFTYLGAYFLVKRLINFVENSSGDELTEKSLTNGYLYALGLFLTSIASSVCIQQVMAQCTRIGVQVRAGLMVLIYRKSLKLSSVHGGIGNIINLISNDCNRVAESFVNFHFLWSSALEILVVIALAFVELKIAAIPALIILILLFPVQYLLSFYTARANAMATNTTTARIHIMSELLTAIKLIKFYAWESYFRERVTRVRAKEMAEIRRGMYLKITSFALVFAAPVLTTLACICVYELTDNRGATGAIEASVVFTILSLFNTLRYPLIMLPIAVKTTLGALISFDRLDSFLLLPEVEPLLRVGFSTMDSDGPKSTSVVAGGLVMNGSNSNSGDVKEMEKMALKREIDSLQIYIKNADFGWPDSQESNPTLKFISMSIKPKELVAIVGDVGSGKSSTLAAIMGQIGLRAGDKVVHGSIAYVPHEAWLLNETLKENILFGSPFNRQKYNDILRVCALNRDLTLLSAGDDTEIGERGINLSQGQRQRVSLARAVYSDAEIMLLDDPLSGMDAQIGKHIFQECIKGYLANKTVVYVTNQLQHLGDCDHIIVMKNGSIEAQGTFDELMANDVNLARIVEESMEIEDPDQIQELMSEVRLEPSSSDLDIESTEKNGENQSSIQRGATIQRGTIGKSLSSRFNNLRVVDTDEELSSVSVQGRPVISKSGKGSVRARPNLLSQRSHSMSNPVTRDTNYTAANEHTIHRLRELNAHTIQNQMINEQTISRMIERNQMTILGGMGPSRLTAAPTNREENSMARAVERNQLTIHSLSGREGVLSGARGERLDLGYGVKSRGGVPGWAVAQAYLRKGTGMGVSIAVALVFLATQGLRIYSDYWLSFTVGSEAKSDFHYYLGVYGGLVAAVIVGVYARTFFLSWVVFRKSITYHDRIFRKILRAPMSYFDVTPLARILNAFARHMYAVDEVLPDAILQMLQYAPLAIGTTILVIVIVPWSAIAVVVLLVIVAGLVKLSSHADDYLKGMEAATKGPIFAHMAATLDGLFSIRVYGAEHRFDAFNLGKIDDNHKAFFAMMQVRSWLSLYLDIVSSIFVLVTAMLVIYFSRNGSVDASQVGLAITNALQLLIFGQWSFRSAVEVMSTKESVCQLELYGMNIPAEAPDHIPESQPPQNWPSQGEIEFKKVVLRYQNYGVAVLKKVSFVVRPGEKIGVVGKMGSGKTTLLISLLRMVEVAEGTILIDDVDIQDIGLQDLRSKIAIIPQEPVLFVGTIRSNLDPFHRRTDQEIWAALDAVHLSENIKQNMPLKLETPIIENGRNFSLGQRQLFCIARAILFQSRILVLDEATSAVDLQTDLLIQETIKKNFSDCTVLMIAHRLNTIIECDKILVMEDGRVVEFEHSTKLIDNKDGYFYNLVNQSGPDAVARLKAMLGEHGQTTESRQPTSRDGPSGTQPTESVQKICEEDGEISQDISQELPSPVSHSQDIAQLCVRSGSSSSSNLEGRGTSNSGEGSSSSASSLAMASSNNFTGMPAPIVSTVATSSSAAHQMPHTEIDWIAYMQEVSGYLRGETDYMKLRGDTGPLVYPAGFVYIYSALYYVTDLGKNILKGQWIFMGLYLINLGIVFTIYSKDRRLPPYILIPLCLSKRLHSIYVLRLFNDPVAMFFFYAATLAFLHKRWTLSSTLFSLAISIKMNILLYFPAFGFLIWQTQGLFGTIIQLSVLLSLPFTLHHPESYIRKAFEFSRVFEYKWTVNWKFLDKKTFLSEDFAKLLLAGHLIVLFAFVFFRWSRSDGGIVPVVLRGFTASRSMLSIHAQYMKPNHVLTLLFTSNFIGIVFARSLHYQFYSWYFMTLPYLLWQTRLPILIRFLLLGAIEWSWNVFPATANSSGVLVASHVIILLGLWVGK
ncbi:Multidrug resistance-associated protein 4 [Haplosporangium sp. Z 27]|nr:Multidrug resistance-associated protein 4 [Haplosporangium sp. Z 27]